MKVVQSCPTLCDPMDYTIHGILQARILEWIAVPFSRGIFPTQGSNPGFLHCRRILYQLSHQVRGGPHFYVEALVVQLLLGGVSHSVIQQAVNERR